MDARPRSPAAEGPPPRRRRRRRRRRWGRRRRWWDAPRRSGCRTRVSAAASARLRTRREGRGPVKRLLGPEVEGCRIQGRARVRAGSGSSAGFGCAAGSTLGRAGSTLGARTAGWGGGRKLARGDELRRGLARHARDRANQPQLRRRAQGARGSARARQVARRPRCVHVRVCRGPPACVACVHDVCTMCVRTRCAHAVHPCGTSAAHLPCSSCLHGVGFLGLRFGLCNGLGLFCGRPLGGTFQQHGRGLDLGWR